MACLITEKKYVYYDLNILWEDSYVKNVKSLPTAMFTILGLKSKMVNSVLVLRNVILDL